MGRVRLCGMDWLPWIILALQLGCVPYQQPIIQGWNCRVQCSSATSVGSDLPWAFGVFQAFWHNVAGGRAEGLQQSDTGDNYDVLRGGRAHATSTDCCDSWDFSNSPWQWLVSTYWIIAGERQRDALGSWPSSGDMGSGKALAALADDAGYCGWKCAEQTARPLVLIHSELHSILGSLGIRPRLNLGVMGTSLIQSPFCVVILGRLAPSNPGSWHSDRKRLLWSLFSFVIIGQSFDNIGRTGHAVP